MSERLVLDVYFDPELKEQMIQPLLFQPLIENAFKYVRGEHRIQLVMMSVKNRILFKISNSISQAQKVNNSKEESVKMRFS